jgi:hypothetical protein
MTSSKSNKSRNTVDGGSAPAPLHSNAIADDNLSRRHLLVGWWSLLQFLSLGIALEAFHGFKLTWYLGVDAETRRLMWTLAHTHGTLISLIHLAFAYATGQCMLGQTTGLVVGSWCLIGAGILMPLGFLLGGTFHYSGDPGLGILLVPPGGILLFVAVMQTAIAVTRAPPT